jgi:hypothetical protein
MRAASPAMRRLPVLSAHARTYKQPARDLMTGEVTQLPDIDVSYNRLGAYMEADI